MQPPGGGGKSGIQRCQGAFQARMEALVNRVNLGIVGNAFERDMRHRLVNEPALEPFLRVAQGKVIKAGGHQALLGQGDGDARGVTGDPAAAPFFGDVGGGARSAGRVKYQVAGIGGHEHAALNNLYCRLNNIIFCIRKTTYSSICPSGVYGRVPEIMQKPYVGNGVARAAQAPSLCEPLRPSSVGLPTPFFRAKSSSI